MVSFCVLCKACSRTADASITFHRFPKDTDKRSKWLQAINMDKAAQFARLCSNHFKTSDFQETITGLRRSLKSTAIPMIISKETNCDDNKNEAAFSKGQYHIGIQQNTSKEQPGAIKIEECSAECNHAAKDNCNSLKRNLMESKEIDGLVKRIKYIKDIKVHEVSKNPDEAAMVLEIALETLAEQQKKIQYLQTHTYKLKQRLQSLTELNKHDNNLISNKSLERLNVSIS